MTQPTLPLVAQPKNQHQLLKLLKALLKAQMANGLLPEKDVNCKKGTRNTIALSAALLVLTVAFSLSYALPTEYLANKSNETSLKEDDYDKMLMIPGFFISFLLSTLTFRLVKGARAHAGLIALALFRTCLHELPVIVLPYGLPLALANPLLLQVMTPPQQNVAYSFTITFITSLQAARVCQGFTSSPFAWTQKSQQPAAGDTNSATVSDYEAQQNTAPETKAVHALNIGALLPWLVAGPLIAYLSGIETNGDMVMGVGICLLNCALKGTGIAFATLFSLLTAYINDRRKKSPATPPNKEGTLNFLGQLAALILAVLSPIGLCAGLHTYNLLTWALDAFITDPVAYQAFCTSTTIVLTLAPFLTFGLDTGCRRKNQAAATLERSQGNRDSTPSQCQRVEWVVNEDEESPQGSRPPSGRLFDTRQANNSGNDGVCKTLTYGTNDNK